MEKNQKELLQLVQIGLYCMDEYVQEKWYKSLKMATLNMILKNLYQTKLQITQIKYAENNSSN
jgi:hypothetical protein